MARLAAVGARADRRFLHARGFHQARKLSDLLKRLHGPTKASTLGIGCVLIASMIYFAATREPSAHELLISLFLFMTAPVAAHLLIKGALRGDPKLAPPDPPETEHRQIKEKTQEK